MQYKDEDVSYYYDGMHSVKYYPYKIPIIDYSSWIYDE